MLHGNKTRVLIVGAGPVGLMAALVLARNKVKATIIDSASRTTTRSYACALHPATLQLFSELGLKSEILSLGHQVRKLGLYNRSARQGEIDFHHLTEDYPFLLITAQSALEELLENRLANDYGVAVSWRHRLVELEQHSGLVMTTVDRREKSARGYVIAETEDAVKDTLSIPAEFVIGADGYNSRVRKAVKIDFVPHGEPKKFAMCEFETDISLGEAAGLCLDDETENALWPVSSDRCRWIFELPADVRWEFPKKERSVFSVIDSRADSDTREFVMRILADRASWFGGRIGEIQEFDEAQFQPGVVERFGKDRCWLAGESAHQADPIGSHSVNVGLREAADVATRIARILRGESLHLLNSYESERLQEWERLLAARRQPHPRNPLEPIPTDWFVEHREQILSCVPLSDRELESALA